MISITASIFNFIYILLVTLVYFSKGRINNKENTIYTYILITSLIGIFLDSISGILYLNGFNSDSIFYQFLTKLILLFYVVWDMMMLEYIIVISKQQEKIDKYIKITTVLIFVFGTIMLLSPLKIVTDGINAHPEGFGILLMYVITLALTVITIYALIKNYKHLKSKKYIPLFLYLFFGILMLIVQNLTGTLLMTSVDIFITILMFFTIENPDVRMIQELHKSKEISDNANEEKTLFLFNMTQEIREVTNKINEDADIILDSKDYDEIYDVARDIKAKSNAFSSATNDILDMSSVDATTIKIYNNKYNVKNIIKQLVNVYNDICKNKEIKFRTNIDHDIPDSLYGDGINLKEVLTTILNNSTKYTDKGYVELSVNTIIKNDICRLIFTIEDSGKGIKSEDINKIKIDNKSLAKANKMITLMNGTMLISSDYGIGTKVKVIIDQKIAETETTEVSKYESTFNNVSILSVDDSESGLKIIEKLLKGTNVKLDLASTGKECLDKIKIGKYDLILLDEELSQISGIELMEKIKEIRNFKTPVILLTKDNSYEYNEEYTKAGFVDYLLKPLKKEELLLKIDKYTKKDKK